ncbi:MAG TPA: hypothetical protein VJK09_00640 [Candidatus Paceibacterota bacterium]
MKKEHWLYVVIAILAIWVIASYATAPRTDVPDSMDEETGVVNNEMPVPGSGVPEMVVNTDNFVSNDAVLEASLSGTIDAGPNKGTLIDTAPTKSAVKVSNQLAGSMVKIDNVSLAFDGWVVIHEDRDGTPGNALGAQRFDKGSYAGGQVELARGTVTGGKYYAMLHVDDGDKMFDLKTDLPATQDGTMVMAVFSAQ